MSAYWEGRMIARQRIYDRAADETVAILYAAYNRVSRQIGRDMQVIFENFRNMYDLTKEQAKKLLSAPAPYEFLAELKARVAKMENGPQKTRLLAHLSSPAYAARITRLQAMQESARVALSQVAEIEVKADRKALTAASETAYMRTMFDVQKASGLMFPVAGVSEKRLSEVLRNQWIGKNYSARVWHNTGETARLTAQALEEMLLSGKASQETFRDIMKAAITKDGISPEQRIAQGKMAANRLLRTEYNYVTGQADMDAYEDAGFDRYRYMAVLDGRTSTICRYLDGKVFHVKDRKVGVNMHPMHPWCRSTTEPIFEDLVIENQTRWARDPVTGEEMHVPADMTYREWEKKQAELRLQTADKRANMELAVTKNEKKQAEILARIRSEATVKTINPEKQQRHIKESDGYKAGRSYLYGGEAEAQRLVNQYAGKGIPNFTRKGEWAQTELVILDHDIGVNVTESGKESLTNAFKIHYSKTGTHVVPTKRR